MLRSVWTFLQPLRKSKGSFSDVMVSSDTLLFLHYECEFIKKYYCIYMFRHYFE